MQHIQHILVLSLKTCYFENYDACTPKRFCLNCFAYRFCTLTPFPLESHPHHNSQLYCIYFCFCIWHIIMRYCILLIHSGWKHSGTSWFTWSLILRWTGGSHGRRFWRRDRRGAIHPNPSPQTSYWRKRYRIKNDWKITASQTPGICHTKNSWKLINK